ncbi:MAG: OmpA family protein, partial [Aestuariivirga sp.]
MVPPWPKPRRRWPKPWPRAAFRSMPDVGKDSDNMELSLKRAKSVYDYLIKAGIEGNRLTYVGYGETQFAVP